MRSSRGLEMEQLSALRVAKDGTSRSRVGMDSERSRSERASGGAPSPRLETRRGQGRVKLTFSVDATGGMI